MAMIKRNPHVNRWTFMEFLSAALAAMAMATVPSGSISAGKPESATPINIGSRLELFLDDYLIDSMRNLSFQLHSPRPAEKVLFFDKPWENPYSSYVTVFQDGDLFRMYYPVHHVDETGENPKWDESRDVTCYAESRDGIHWTKPSLGIAKFEGQETNIVFRGGFNSHNFAPFIDPRRGVPKSERYKAVGGCKAPGLGMPRMFASRPTPSIGGRCMRGSCRSESCPAIFLPGTCCFGTRSKNSSRFTTEPISNRILPYASASVTALTVTWPGARREICARGPTRNRFPSSTRRRTSSSTPVPRCRTFARHICICHFRCGTWHTASR